MKAEILSIGTELTLGEIVDTNASYLASELLDLGIDLQCITQIPDTIEVIIEAILQALNRSQLVLTTGGLGPTQDDLTREAIAQALDEEMVLQADLVEDLSRYFQTRGIAMSDRNLKQATLISSAEILPNSRGTAPGWWVEKSGSIIVAQPGPPAEMMEMWNTQVIPRLQQRVRGKVILTRTLKTIGLPESTIADLVAPQFESVNPYLGIYTRSDGIHLRILAESTDMASAHKLIEPIEQALRSALGKSIWGTENETPQQRVDVFFKSRGFSLAVLETSTGGLLTTTITDIDGSEHYFKGSIVTSLSNLSIIQGIDHAQLGPYTIANQRSSEILAQQIRLMLKADIGIAVIGPTERDAERHDAANTVFVSIDSHEEIRSFNLTLSSRHTIFKSRIVAQTLLEVAKISGQS